MADTLETAIERIKSVGDRTAVTQVYYFDDYEFDPETGIGDPTALCERLGIPLIDEFEVNVEYPVKKTFFPLPTEQIADAEQSVRAYLPDDYKALLSTFGTFHLPGRAEIIMASPASAISWTAETWGFADPGTMSVLAISPYHVDADGNCIGFRRGATAFGPELYIFDHDLRCKGDDPTLWTERIADSLADFIVAYIDGLD